MLQGNLHISFLENISAVRQATIDKLLDIPYAHVDRYENANDIICRRKSRQKDCDALVYGSLIRGLQIAGLWPRKKPEEIHISIDQLASTLDSLEIFVLPDIDSGYRHDYRTNHNHASCSVHNFKQQVHTALSGIPYPVLDSHYRHMEAQRPTKPIEIGGIKSIKLFSFRHKDKRKRSGVVSPSCCPYFPIQVGFKGRTRSAVDALTGDGTTLKYSIGPLLWRIKRLKHPAYHSPILQDNYLRCDSTDEDEGREYHSKAWRLGRADYLSSNSFIHSLNRDLTWAYLHVMLLHRRF